MFDLPEKKSYKVIGIVGSRRRISIVDWNLVFEAFTKIRKVGDRIVSGGCPEGADNMAEIIAKKIQCPITIHYAEWDRLGKGAGIIRNTDIAKDCDVLIACPASDRTGGTEDTIAKVLKMGKEVILV